MTSWVKIRLNSKKAVLWKFFIFGTIKSYELGEVLKMDLPDAPQD